MRIAILALLLSSCATEPNTRELLKHKMVVCVEIERVEYCEKQGKKVTGNDAISKLPVIE